MQLLLVGGIAFLVIMGLTSFLRFQVRMERSASVDPVGPEAGDAFRYLVAGRLATGPRQPAPFLLLRLGLSRDVLEALRVNSADVQRLGTFLVEHVRPWLRADDVVLRVGPMDLGIIVPGDQTTAERVGPRALEAFREVEFRSEAGDGLPLRVNVGVVRFPADADALDPLLDAAELALERARDQGSHRWFIRPAGDIPAAPAELLEHVMADVPQGQRHLVDSVTGLLREDHLGSSLQKLAAKARDRKRPLSVVCLAVDHIDRYQDHCGAEGIDQLMEHVARFLKRSVREDDLLARYGTHQIVIVMGCAPDAALGAAQRLAEAIRHRTVQIGEAELKLKISGGVAGFPEHGTVPSEVLERAVSAWKRAAGRARGLCLLYQPEADAQASVDAGQETF